MREVIRITTRRRILVVAGLIVIAGLGLQSAMAASLSNTAGPLSGRTVSVTECDADGIAFRYVQDTAGRVTGVTVSSIDGSCAGATLRLTLVNGSANIGSGTASLPASGFTGSASVSMAPTPASNVVTAAYLVVEGP
jgi:hypothetical protein